MDKEDSIAEVVQEILDNEPYERGPDTYNWFYSRLTRLVTRCLDAEYALLNQVTSQMHAGFELKRIFKEGS